MISLLSLPAIVFLYIFAGIPYASNLPRSSVIERLSLSFLVGGGVTTFAWFLLARLGLRIDLLSLVLSVAITHLLGRLFFKVSDLRGQALQATSQSSFLLIEKIGLILIGFLIFSHLVITAYNPITSWDSIALYDFAGRIIAQTGDLSAIMRSSYYMSYPLYVSLSHTASYLLGAINPQGFHTIVFMSLLGIIYGRITHWTNRSYGILATLLVTSSYQIFYHASYAYTNIPYVAFLIAGYLYVISQDRAQSHSKDLMLGSLLIGLSTWTRSSEPFWMIGILLILWQGISLKKYLVSIFGAGLVIFIRYLWVSFHAQVLASYQGVASTASHHLLSLETISKIINNLPELTWYILLNVVHPYLGFWLVLIPIAIIAIYKKNLRLLQLLFSSFLVLGIVVGGIALFSTYYASWNEIGDSARRMVLFIIPLSLITSVYALYLVKEKNHDH